MMLTIGLAALAPAAAQASPAGTLHWTACDGGLRCATLAVPLDYDHPHGASISLALAKLPAGDPAHRIGSLFINPGGPGGSGVDFVEQAGPVLFTLEVSARFDLVGFDPRGIGRSTPLICFDSEDDALAAFPPFPYPNSAATTRAWLGYDRAQQQHCATQGGPILNHMATADAARDLDRMRAAVGDRGLTYYGVSYGSFLGNTYANLFPGRVRSLVIDGVLDPIAWTTGRDHEARTLPFSTRLHSAAGAQATLLEFFRLCDAGAANCAFAPHAASRYRALFRTLRRNPLPVTNDDGSMFACDESFLVSDTLGAMYDPSGWPDFAQFLADLESAASPSLLGSRLAALHQSAAFEDYFNFVEGFPGVACTDSVNPTSPKAWVRAANESARTNGRTVRVGLDVDHQRVQSVAGPRLGSIPRPVHAPHGESRSRSGESVRSRDAVSGRPDRGQIAAELTVADRARLGPHLAVPVGLRRRGERAHLLTSHPPAKGTVCNQDVIPLRPAGLLVRACRGSRCAEHDDDLDPTALEPGALELG